MTPVLLWTDAPDPYRAAVEAAGLGDRVALTALPRGTMPDDAQLAATEAMLAWGGPPGVLARMPRLRWVQALTAGVETWLARPDLPPALLLTCARGTHRSSMPENILGGLLHIAKPYHAAALDQRERRWTRRVPRPLAGATLGVLGLGAIGQEVARLALALGMRVIGTRRGGAALPGPLAAVVEVLPPEGTDAVLAAADYLLLLLPVTPETDGLIDAARLARMRPEAWLLNFGRGQLVVDADLVAAVQARRIAGAVLDVFRTEPLPEDHPFWTTPGILVLPHIGGLHPARDAIVAGLFADNLRRFLDGAALREVVDRAAGY